MENEFYATRKEEAQMCISPNLGDLFRPSISVTSRAPLIRDVIDLTLAAVGLQPAAKVWANISIVCRR